MLLSNHSCSIRQAVPWLRHIFADGGYAGPKLRAALPKIDDWTIEIAKSFQIMLTPRGGRWQMSSLRSLMQPSDPTQALSSGVPRA